MHSTSPMKYFVTCKIVYRVGLRFSFFGFLVFNITANFRLLILSVSYLDLVELFLVFVFTWREALAPGQVSTQQLRAETGPVPPLYTPRRGQGEPCLSTANSVKEHVGWTSLLIF